MKIYTVTVSLNTGCVVDIRTYGSKKEAENKYNQLLKRHGNKDVRVEWHITRLQRKRINKESK
tara:strand:+ start:229 stop:417 length:189 start_codon:yes stop_codon:yes gene_type:complete